MATMGAISIPMIIKSINGMRLVSLPMGVALSLLFFFRVIHKPSIGRFIIWGLAMALGAYTYTGFRIWIFYLIFSLLLWLLWTHRGKVLSSGIFYPTLFTSRFSVELFLQANGYLSSDTGTLRYFLLPTFTFSLAGLVAIPFVNPFQSCHRGSQNLPWLGLGNLNQPNNNFSHSYAKRNY